MAISTHAPRRGEPLAGMVLGNLGRDGFAITPDEARQLAQKLVADAEQAELEGAETLRDALAARATAWERAAAQMAESAGEQPSSYDEVESDAMHAIYAECAGVLRELLEQFSAG